MSHGGIRGERKRENWRRMGGRLARCLGRSPRRPRRRGPQHRDRGVAKRMSAIASAEHLFS